jgi:hypothetical protein
MLYITDDPENGRYLHVSLGAPPGYFEPLMRDLEDIGNSSAADEQAEALAAALAITARLPAGGPRTPWPFVRRRR